MSQFDWQGAQKDQPEPSLEGGASGYLSAPSDQLDPALFDGDVFQKDVASKIMHPLLTYLESIGLKSMGSWLKAWVAGSGITHQWQSDRGNGDLDILLGVDESSFDNANPDYAGIGDEELSNYLNGRLRADLWPKTASTNINGKTFEVTYFYNASTFDDITRIHPYAAYSIFPSLGWTVRPPEHTATPSDFPQDWWHSTEQDQLYTEHLVKRYKHHTNALSASQPGSPGVINSGAALNLVTSQAHALLDGIHHGRTAAFQGGGQGYMDFHNFRWQRAKANGVVKALSEITGAQGRAETESEETLYGQKLPSTDDLLMRAMMQRKNTP
jgi:hypothetical protein